MKSTAGWCNSRTLKLDGNRYAGTVDCDVCTSGREPCGKGALVDSDVGYFCEEHMKLAEEIGIRLIKLPPAPPAFLAMWGILK